MNGSGDDQAPAPLYRVDKFAVPAPARAEFLARVNATHAFLRRQDGFVQDYILEQRSGPGEFNFVTFVEWADASMVAPVAAAVAEFHKTLGFDRQEMIARLGIKADIANYQRLQS
ncbi:antibiotic biosynthesis monooxygenase [Phreatobacter stygius]|uniref:Antibiotic biosynthesis monooxygenase n=1 Tax=Phreatobacter stygius TaxID=1940610 RepID=A0A4D7BMM1_9HYPH|nr:antibiotic biosynthesis monooxygenase [Phreatobacter stygius]QCI68902.1 antibiotic biosynthesis monooxygenase [Phreatobacter stygius]